MAAHPAPQATAIPADVFETIRGLVIAAKEGAEIALDEHHWRDIAVENIKHYDAAIEWLDKAERGE